MNNLNWYDLNEIWVCLNHEIDKNIEGRKENTKAVLDKVKALMKELDEQPTNQSDYELRVTRKY